MGVEYEKLDIQILAYKIIIILEIQSEQTIQVMQQSEKKLEQRCILDDTASKNRNQGILEDQFSEFCPLHSQEGQSRAHRQIKMGKRKSIENCRRTARILIIDKLTYLTQQIPEVKKALLQILSQYKKKLKDNQSRVSKSYFNSANFGRIKICQEDFINNILTNPIFRRPLISIFDDTESLLNSNLIRKNKKGALVLSQRKAIIQNVIKQYATIMFEPSSYKRKKIKKQKNEPDKFVGENQENGQGKPIVSPKHNSLMFRFPYSYHQNYPLLMSISERQKWVHFWTCQAEFSKIFRFIEKH